MARSCDTPSHPSPIIRILAQPRRVKYFRSIEGIMPATTGYFAWGCFPYFSWEREPPRPQVVANGKSGQPGRFEEDGEGSAAVGKGGSLPASWAALSPHPCVTAPPLSLEEHRGACHHYASAIALVV